MKFQKDGVINYLTTNRIRGYYNSTVTSIQDLRLIHT